MIAYPHRRTAPSAPDLERMVREVSRTFALSIEELPRGLREEVGTAYLLLRVSDILEDHGAMPPERKAGLLDLWATVLDGHASERDLAAAIGDLDPADPQVALARDARVVLDALSTLAPAARSAIVRHVTDSTRGMARWQRHGPFVEDEAALDDYMHEVAGRVGYLVTELFATAYPVLQPRREALMPLSRESGLALQTVNVIRGLRADYERGWVFVPETYMARAGLSRRGLFEPGNVAAALRVVDMLADKAERHLDVGLAYVTAFPRRLYRARLSLIWPCFFAARTLAISRGNPAVLSGEAKITRRDVGWIIAQTRAFAFSDSWLRWTYRRLKSRTTSLPAIP